MNPTKLTPALAIFAAAVLMLAAPTGAVTLGTPDEPFDGNDVVLAPYDGPNGEYASVGDDGELSVDLSTTGVNNDGETTVERVFVVENRGDETARVWVTHDATESVVLYESITNGGVRTASEIDQRAIQGASNNVTLDAGEHIVASVYVDTRSDDVATGDTLLNEITLHVRQSDDSSDDDDSAAGDDGEGSDDGEGGDDGQTGDDGPAGDDGEAGEDIEVGPDGIGAALDTTGTIDEESETDTAVDDTADASGEDGSGDDTADASGDDDSTAEDEGFTVEELNPDDIPENVGTGSEESDGDPVSDSEQSDVDLDSDSEQSSAGSDSEQSGADSNSDSGSDSRAQPDAVITDADTTESGSNDGAIAVEGTDKVTTTDESVTLDGHQSKIKRTSGVETDRRIVRAADITPPAGQEGQSGTVRMAVSRDRLQTTPENAQMGHLTEDGWELLETEVVARNDDTVVYEAETSSFSPFAVFDGPDVTYEWTLPDGSTVEGPDVRSSFSEPGFYNVTLTVTDGLGNTDTAEYRILVNDEPDVTIETDGPVTAGQETTLRANVTDDVGNVTVTWQLPNGQEVEGRTVNHTFTNGTFDVSVTAEDEFGATGTAQTTITTDEETLPVVSAGSFPLLTLLLSTGFLVLVAAMLLWIRRFGLPALLTGITIPTREGKHPRITAFDDPSWDPRRERFEIGQLRVEDAKEDLETVEVGIRTPDGTEVARKTIDFNGTDGYEASSLRLSSASSEYVDPTRKYNARVRAVDAADNEDTAVSTVRFVRAVSSKPTHQYGTSAD